MWRWIIKSRQYQLFNLLDLIVDCSCHCIQRLHKRDLSMLNGVAPMRQSPLHCINTSFGIVHFRLRINKFLTDTSVCMGYLALKVGNLLFELNDPWAPTLIWLIFILRLRIWLIMPTRHTTASYSINTLKELPVDGPLIISPQKR